jgi:hypothetical protein
MNITRHHRGSAGAATGVLPLVNAQLPAHMLPSATRLGPGDASQGEQRETARAFVFVGDTLNKSVTAAILGTATLQLQGTNDEPTLGGAVWSVLGTELTATGSITSTAPVSWVRLNKTSGTGTIEASLHAAAV